MVSAAIMAATAITIVTTTTRDTTATTTNRRDPKTECRGAPEQFGAPFR
jgi:hypothetical protein